jgi:hypothetical protein
MNLVIRIEYLLILMKIQNFSKSEIFLDLGENLKHLNKMRL